MTYSPLQKLWAAVAFSTCVTAAVLYESMPVEAPPPPHTSAAATQTLPTDNPNEDTRNVDVSPAFTNKEKKEIKQAGEDFRTALNRVKNTQTPWQIFLAAHYAGISPEDAAALIYLESTFGHLSQNLTSAKGAAQVTFDTMMSYIKIYGEECHPLIERHDPVGATVLALVSPYISLVKNKRFDPEKSGFAEARNLAIRKLHTESMDSEARKYLGRVLALPIGKQIDFLKQRTFLPALFSFMDAAKNKPLLEKHIKPGSFAAKLTSKYGAGFLYWLIHNWGYGTACKMIDSPPRRFAGFVLAGNTATKEKLQGAGQTLKNNGHAPDAKACDVLEKMARKFYKASCGASNCLTDPAYATIVRINGNEKVREFYADFGETALANKQGSKPQEKPENGAAKITKPDQPAIGKTKIAKYNKSPVPVAFAAEKKSTASNTQKRKDAAFLAKAKPPTTGKKLLQASQLARR
jgi:hypothetical protein